MHEIAPVLRKATAWRLPCPPSRETPVRLALSSLFQIFALDGKKIPTQTANKIVAAEIQKRKQEIAAEPAAAVLVKGQQGRADALVISKEAEGNAAHHPCPKPPQVTAAAF